MNNGKALLKALANEDTLLLMMFLGCANAGDRQNECCVSILGKLGNICCGHKMFLNKIRNIFCDPRQMLRARTNI